MKKSTINKLKKLLKGVSVASLVMLGVAGCNAADSAVKNDSKASTWPKEITIAQMPDESNPDAGSKNNEFREAMENYLGIKVKEMEGADYAVGIEALSHDKLDVMLVSPMSFFQAKEKTAITPLVTTGAIDGTPYRTVFITKSDRKEITKLKDLKDTTFAFVDPSSSSGYMYPKATLVKELSLESDKLENPGYFFKTVAYSGKHDASIMGVKMGDYDGAAVAEQIMTDMIDAGLVEKSELKIIDTTAEIPNACYIARGNLPADLKEKIKQFYLEYDNETYFETFYKDKNVRFKEAKESDYAVVAEMIETLNIKE